MAIKNFTSLEQSRKLAEILPLESADMHYKVNRHNNESKIFMMPYSELGHYKDNNYQYCVCAWSLAALLGVLPILERKGYQKAKPRLLYNVAINKWIVDSHIYTTDAYDNPVDACVDMIIRLNELNLL